MVVNAILFDLDGTLVDTSSIEKMRAGRKWKECVGSLSRTQCYPGIADTLSKLRQQSIGIAIVTSSVSFYAVAVCKYHGILYDALISYHDAKPKPAPDPFLLAIRRLGIEKNNALGVGDASLDALSLSAAGIKSAGAGWNPNLHRNIPWGVLLNEPGDIINFILSNDR
jgi:phosphoglycolate phosphatase-like HAD superfamily hydrolase